MPCSPRAEPAALAPTSSGLIARWPAGETESRPAPSGRRVGSLFEEIIRCMVDGRRPAALEIERVAAGIWAEVQAGPDRLPWTGLVFGSDGHRRMIRAARAALGDLEDRGAPACPSPGRSTWREHLFWVGTTDARVAVGRKSGIKLDGTTLADIFLGKIKTWNDPAIKSLNPGLSLPSTNITVVHRSDSSGTTKAFTTFLSANSPSVDGGRRQPDKIVKWPIGTGGQELRRRRGDQADRGSRRLRRAGLRAAERIHVRLDEEQLGQVPTAHAPGHLGRGQWHQIPKDRRSARSTRPTRRLIRSCPRRS